MVPNEKIESKARQKNQSLAIGTNKNIVQRKPHSGYSSGRATPDHEYPIEAKGFGTQEKHPDEHTH